MLGAPTQHFLLVLNFINCFDINDGRATLVDMSQVGIPVHGRVGGIGSAPHGDFKIYYSSA